MEGAKDWNDRYVNQDIGWDIGYPSTPIQTYIDQLEDKSQPILIPGCGHAYEGEHLHQQGFNNVTLSDLSEVAKTNFLERVPSFPENRFLVGDFFALNGPYDLILEQTFYCALPPSMRPDYLKKMHELLRPGGKLAGLLFSFPLTEKGPPFGGDPVVYKETFGTYFNLKTMEPAHNSIGPRQGNEIFFIAEKRDS